MSGLLPGSPNSLPPVGLLGLFGIKSQGATPKPLDGLQFGFDVQQFYTRGQEAVARYTAAPAAVGITILTDTVTAQSLIVPQGKAWLVTGASGRVTTTALQCFRGVIVGSSVSVGGNVEIAELTTEMRSSQTDATGVAYASSAWPFGAQGLLFGPGSGFHVVTRFLTAGPVTVSGGIRYYEFPY